MRLRYLVTVLTPLFLVLGGITLFSARNSLAQDTTCSALVQQALTDVGTNCGDLGRNTACYGYNRVEATFTEAVAEDFFSKPSDQSTLATLQTVQTAPLDVDLDQWGVAVLSVQANIPNTLPGQAVKFILLGDTQIENAVSPEDAFQAAASPLPVTATVAANVRSRPTTSANVIGSIPAGAALAADAISPDKAWVRVTYNETAPGWISLQVVNVDGDLSTLPEYSQDSRTPMQAFYFHTGADGLNCTEAPSLLMVQGPEHVTVDITANGADIRISSTILLQTDPETGTMHIAVGSGEAKVGGVIVPAGFTVDAPLTDDGNEVNGPLMNLRPLTTDELEQYQTIENLPGDLLNYRVELPTEDEIQQTLSVVNGGGGSTNDAGVTTGPAAGQADCSGFGVTSPLEAWGRQPTTFYWNGARGATSYRLNTPAGSVETTSLNATIDLGGVGGDTLSWNVDALVNGVVACSSGATLGTRDVSIQPQAPQQSCPTSGSC